MYLLLMFTIRFYDYDNNSISSYDDDDDGIASIVDNRMFVAGLGGSVGCAVRLETGRLRVQPPPRSATFFRGD